MKRDKRLDIQALRAIAVLAVVLYHLWPQRLIGGFMGVDIFFVISGYLMTLTLLKNMQPVLDAKEGKLRQTFSYLSNFYARRIKRLLPAAAVALLGVLLLVMVSGQYYLQQTTAKHVIASAVFAENWLLASESVDYLAESESASAVQHFWSLSLEEQFYLAWPLLLLIFAAVTIHVTILYKQKKMLGTILPVALLAAIFFIYGYFATKHSPAAAYFVTPARVWELILGGVIAFLPILKNHDLKLLLPWLGAALCSYAIYAIGGDNFPGWHALIPTIGTALIIYAGTEHSESKWSFDNLLRFRPIQFIGDISYSLYLWHWPFIILLPVLLGVDISTSLKIGIFILSIIVGWLSYRYVEQPTQRINLKKYQTYIAFFVIVGAIVGAGYYVSSTAKAAISDGVKSFHAAAIDKENRVCFGARAIQNQDVCGDRFGEIDTGYAQFIKSDASLLMIHDDKWCSYYRIGEQDDPTKYCTIGDTSAQKQIVLWGDSHIDQYANAFDDIGRRNHIKFVLFSSGSCAADIIDEPECADRLQFIDEQKFLTDSDTVIVSFLAKDNLSRAATTIETLRSKTDKPIYYIQDVPVADGNNGVDCFLTHKSCTSDRETALQTANSLLDDMIRSDVIDSNHVIHTEDLFCKDTTCYSFIGGVSVYRDSNGIDNSHISSAYSLSLADLLEEKLRQKGAL